MSTAIESRDARPAGKRSGVRRRLVRTTLAMGMALGTVVATSTPAFAAISTCTIWWTGPGACTTGAVTPYPGGTWVDWRVGGGAFGSTGWYMYDVSNGIRVAAGNVPAGETHTGTVSGLYNRADGYKIRISSSYAGFGTIENELP
ncbi:hypothetical protein [Saccharothrix luteola]|uniref:hypothetical protein n=1 Tax=Saccharothrix luteola TaxID=2893018 RepID=UPI001E2C46E8|nr:hypothetical protein [Saccharothrix luteola]MCC8246419.1 hypothetical protein [Saccharothrix luteola]